MAIETVTSFAELMRLAGALGKARMRHQNNPTSENEELLREAQAEHDYYHKLCLEADRMIVAMPREGRTP